MPAKIQTIYPKKQMGMGGCLRYKEELEDVLGRSVPTVIRIPVVVHVLHNGVPIGTGLNISMAQIESQIDVLNEDFRRLNGDAGNTPAEFLPVASDPGIEFYLACTDPNGNPTNGVIRTLGAASYELQFIPNTDDEIDEVATGIKLGAIGSPAWPTDRYLNIWVANLTAPFLGYAQFPADYASKPNTDGVVVSTTSFGRIGNVTAPFHLGRTATHEVGHWLNLFHIFGAETGCGYDDMVADTPIQEDFSEGCPNHPRASCGSNDMFMNYMDYSNDACMNIYTQGQRIRMRALFSPGGVRNTFITSPLGMSVTGPDRICTTNTNFTLQNVPAGQTVTWAVSPTHLFPSNGRTGTGTTASIRAASTSTSGLATLNFTIQTPCGSYQVTKQIWIGAPGALTSILPNYQPICTGEYTYFNAYYNMFNPNQPGNGEADITNYVWTPPSGASCFTAGNKNEVLACWFQTGAGFGMNQTVAVRAVNSCGQGAMSYANFSVSDCFYFSVGLNPNPASNRVTIELTETPLDAEAKAVLGAGNKGAREYQEYSFDSPPHRIRVFDIVGAERLCVENVPEGNRHELDISHLTPGVYVVHLENRNGTVVRQLRVD